MIGGVAVHNGHAASRSGGRLCMAGLFESAAQGVLDCGPARKRPARHGLRAWARHALGPFGMRPAAHHLRLLDGLERVADGGCDRLLVLMPPGSAKSTYASVLFPAWWFHRHPGTQVIAASHTAEFAAGFGRQVRSFIGEHAEWLGYELNRESHAAHRFQTSNRGLYYATGLGGAITGRRADLVLIDDPVKNGIDTEGAAQREATWSWYRTELLPRLKPRGRVVLIMTRWHADDLGGRVLDSGDDWEVLRLPALAEADDPMGRPEGAALWPEWEDLAALERKRNAIGERAWAALYQQRPMPEGGALFNPARVETTGFLSAETNFVRAWDLAATAAGAGRDPDWTVGLKLGREPSGRFVVADVVRLRAGPHEVAETIAEVARCDGTAVAVGLPQDPGQAGKQQVAWLAGRLAGYRVVASPESGAKLTRARPVAAQAEAGNLALLRGAWNAAFLAELGEFPLGRKDDQVDALARAFGMLAAPARAAPARRAFVPLLAR